MNLRSSSRPALLAASCILLVCGCSRDLPTEPWPLNTDPVVFLDAFGEGVEFQAFSGSKLDALAIDTIERHSGTSSLRFTVPAVGDPTGAYAGGAFVARQARSLTPYNALSLWVKGSRAATLDVAGFGNDNTGTSKYEARRSAIAVTTAWTRVLVPIPLSAKLVNERGLCFLAEGPEAGAGMTLWVDDVEFVLDASITNPRPVLASSTVSAIVGTEIDLQGATSTTFTVTGLDRVVSHMPGYFTLVSSAPSVVSPLDGKLLVTGAGNATVTASLGTLLASGAVTVNAAAPPASAAPAPTLPQADVISLFSNAYSNVPVDTWSAVWDQADVADVSIAGNPAKVYSNLVFAGIEFTSHLIDAASMTAVHLDVWVPAGTVFRVKLVDFGPDGAFGGGDDTQSELSFDASSTPALATGTWVALDLPFSSFTTLTGRAHLAQLILSGDTRTVFVDNVYFHR